jgi:hypothetical protein
LISPSKKAATIAGFAGRELTPRSSQNLMKAFAEIV